MNAVSLQAPFPYFGGKSRIAADVWSRFGSVDNYVEPFFGSGAVLLGRPNPSGIETVNDLDGHLCNFWRAVRHSPDAVAEFADWSVSEVDMHARHMVLVEERAALTERLLVDPDYYNAKLAGWWAWGACCWIGHGWCSGDGPWIRESGRMVKRTAKNGVNRQLPHLGNAGQGVNRQLPHLGNAGRLNDWMRSLSDRLRQVRIACGSWERVLGPSITWRHGTTAVFLDPPYIEGNMDYSAGGMGLGASNDVRAWCLENGQRRDMKIAVCGHASEHSALEANGWSRLEWHTSGYGTTQEARERAASETIWFSPSCVTHQLRLI